MVHEAATEPLLDLGIVTKRKDGSGHRRALRILLILVMVLSLLGTGMIAGIVLDRQVVSAFAPPDTVPANAQDQFKLMAEAWNAIQKYYVDRGSATQQQLTYGAISGMVSALGDTGHSRFLSPQMVKQEDDYSRGQFEGIGAEVSTKDSHTVIVAPIDGSPAQKAGLRPGQVIMKVNGDDVTDMPIEQVISRIIGPAGTKVTLTILDPTSGKTNDVTIERARIILHNVTWQILPGTTYAHVRVSAFSDGVSKELASALKDMQQQGVTGIILDMRNNPGGLLSESIGLASQFLSKGNVLLEENAQGQIKPVPVLKDPTAPSLPMVVLINEGTASASEIVAGALQDSHRATLVGATTFGTGTVLNEFGLSDGSAMYLATEEWLTPGGRAIWHKGITPDVAVTLDPSISLLTPEAERTMTAADIQASGDQQFLQALDLLGKSTN